MGKNNSAQNNASIKRKTAALAEALSAAQGKGMSAKKLRNEYNFENYLKMLKSFAQRYCVIAAASDTPWGPPFNRSLTNLFKNIGFQTDLYEMYRNAYAAVIDSGKLVFEKMETDKDKNVDEEIALEETTVHLFSVGFNCFFHTCMHGEIEICGQKKITLSRGLNIVVYDRITQTIIDYAAFDVFADSIPCQKPYLYAQRIKEYKERNPDVTVLTYQAPQFPKNAITAGEKFIIDNNINYGREIILGNLNKHIFALNNYFDEEGITEVLSVPNSYRGVNGIRRFEDTHGKYVNTVDGHRVTEYQPKQNIDCDNIYIYIYMRRLYSIRSGRGR
ncbi:MAG: hypothetical protein NC394_09175 [Bacteroides sp.]|nr:hypothetical protein [Bacteroides sp.]